MGVLFRVHFKPLPPLKGSFNLFRWHPAFLDEAVRKNRRNIIEKEVQNTVVFSL